MRSVRSAKTKLRCCESLNPLLKLQAPYRHLYGTSIRDFYADNCYKGIRHICGQLCSLHPEARKVIQNYNPYL